MSKEIELADAQDWSDEEAADNIRYLEDRTRYEEANQVRQARAGQTASETAEGSNQDPEPSAEPTPQQPQVDLTEMTAQQVSEWVGDDPERARVALAMEQQRDEPRKKLSEALERLVGE